jgi:hypothetical protein
MLETKKPSLYAPNEFWRILILTVILVYGFGTRLYDFAAGVPILVKSTSLFFLIFGMVVVVIYQIKLWDVLKDIQVWLIAGLSHA